MKKFTVSVIALIAMMFLGASSVNADEMKCGASMKCGAAMQKNMKMGKGCDAKTCPNPNCAAKKDPKAKCDCNMTKNMKCGASMKNMPAKKCGANK